MPSRRDTIKCQHLLKLFNTYKNIRYLPIESPFLQEGLLDIDLEFSDGSHTALRDVAVSDYYLLVESLDPEVVAFAPMLASRHPRVIAVGEGKFKIKK